MLGHEEPYSRLSRWRGALSRHVFAPIDDRDAPGKGFSHKTDDIVTIASAMLGRLVRSARGIATGMKIRVIICRYPAPPINAASSSSFGIEPK
jgi:hypothetical protein